MPKIKTRNDIRKHLVQVGEDYSSADRQHEPKATLHAAKQVSGSSNPKSFTRKIPIVILLCICAVVNFSPSNVRDMVLNNQRDNNDILSTVEGLNKSTSTTTVVKANSSTMQHGNVKSKRRKKSMGCLRRVCDPHVPKWRWWWFLAGQWRWGQL